MKKMKSFLTMFMVAALIVSCIPAAAFAAETGTEKAPVLNAVFEMSESFTRNLQ